MGCLLKLLYYFLQRKSIKKSRLRPAQNTGSQASKVYLIIADTKLFHLYPCNIVHAFDDLRKIVECGYLV